MTPRQPADHLERARAWMETLTVGLETGDLDAVGRGIGVRGTWQPGPFAPSLRGRAAILGHLAARLGSMPALSTRAEILGASATHLVAHWTLAWRGGGPGERADGVLLVSLDPMGRAAAVREWTLADSASDPATATVTATTPR